jgi:hypothetical protein
VTNADSSVSTTTDLYYEATCVTLESEEMVNDVSPGNATDSGTGTIATYDRSGTVSSFHKLTLGLTPTGSGASETITVQDAYSASNGGTALGTVGATCVGNPNSPAMSCTTAQAGVASGEGFGQAFSLTVTAGTGGAQNAVQISAAYFDGNGLGTAQSGSAWGVTGAATSFNSVFGSYSYTTTGTSGSGTLTLSDNVYTYTETATLSATGLSVTIIRGTDPIATATIDVAGTGTINYADGSTDVVWGGVVGA